MCTAVRFKARGIYYGRTLDLEYSLGEGVVMTPRRCALSFRHSKCMREHYAMLGIGIVADGYPLYYDAMNEHGLWIAGLNFPQYAQYNSGRRGMLNLASYELVPFILSRCATVTEAEVILESANITSEPFSENFPPTPMHWMICDREHCAVIEQTEQGLAIHESDIGVLTNSPPYDMQTENLSRYLSLTPNPPVSRFSDETTLSPCSRGMGAYGLPGDVSSMSRFVRAAFTLANASIPEGEDDSVGQLYHILGSVEQVSGTVRLEGGSLERTVYTSCADPQRMTYYYTTYENSTPTAVKLDPSALVESSPTFYPFDRRMRITHQN